MIDFMPKNAVPEEWVNPDAPPAFDDIASGMAFMDEQGKAALKELEAEARRRMAADQDPRDQNYFLRTDKRTVVRTDKEYVYCELEGISMKVIPYSAAVQALKEQESRERNKAKSKQKKKAANKARRKNR
jgi:hypothetical protein